MRLQSISQEAANKIWRMRSSGGDVDTSPIIIDPIGDYEKDLTDSELVDLVDKLRIVQSQHTDKITKFNSETIDSKLPEIIHSELLKYAQVPELSQIGFWCWLSNVACEGYFWDFIMWRFNSDQTINWGITSQSKIIEVYLYRAWLRGHKMYDERAEDPYRYARLGASDVWRSHILRQDFGRDKEFVRAFLDTIHDDNGKSLVSRDELRQKIIPPLRAWTSGASFSHLSYEENLELIAYLREKGI